MLLDAEVLKRVGVTVNVSVKGIGLDLGQNGVVIGFSLVLNRLFKQLRHHIINIVKVR